jgi:acetyltransferase-like isoleucine patch superfamily enzyme
VQRLTIQEAKLWRMGVVKYVPGFVGCALRNVVLPYDRGKRVRIWENVQIDGPEGLRMGDDVAINRNSTISAHGGVTIGDHVIVGPGVTLYAQNHRYDDPGRPIMEQGYTYNPVTIGSNVWIAAHVIVLPGVSIGDNVVVGAGAVVTRDVEPGVVVAGNPARVIRRLSTPTMAVDSTYAPSTSSAT